MWVRKRIDIGWSGIGYGLLRCLFPGKSAEHSLHIASVLPYPEEAVICLSVRSGFDLLLTALRLPDASEVLLSALTLGHMADIVRAHGLVPVPVDLDPETMAPDAESLERTIGPNTRLLLVAHLFGGRCRIGSIAKICRRGNILIVEDMAQAFGSGQRWGSGESDVAMFSFGTIKTATAGGGAVLRVRDVDLADRMRIALTAYPIQRRSAFALKLCRIAGLKLLAHRIPYALFRRICLLLRIDIELLLSQSTRAFPGVRLIENIRKKPHPALLALLYNRIRDFDPRKIRHRTRIGRLLRKQLAGVVVMPGSSAIGQTHWVFPVLVPEPEKAVRKLVSAGFDATSRQSMEVILEPSQSNDMKPVRTSDMFPRMVYLPAYPEMGGSEILRMARVLSEHILESQTGTPIAPE